MTLWIVDNTCPFNRVNSEWQIIWPILRRKLFGIVKLKIISTDYNVASLDYTTQIGFTGAILNQFIKTAHKIEHRDIILFTDARSEMISIVYEYFIFKKIRPYFMGYWNDGLFNPNGGIAAGYKNKQVKPLPRSHEAHLAKMYDLNLVTTNPLLNYFKENVSVKVKHVNPPFILLKDAYKALGVDISEKSSNIIYNTREALQNVGNQEFIWSVFRRESPDKDFFNMSEIKSHDWRKALHIVARSKLMISFRTTNVNPYDIYHAAILGLLPLLPSSYILKSFKIPKTYLLEPRLIEGKLYKFIRYVPEIKEKMTYIIDNYIELKEELINILDENYNESDFVNLINNVKHRRKFMVGRKVPAQND